MKKICIGSLALAILHSILFFGQKLGVSVLLYTIAILFFIISILNENGKIKNQKPLVLSIPIILLSMTYFIFNNAFFYFWNMIVMIALFIIMLILAVLEETQMKQIINRFFELIGKPFTKIEEVINIIINLFYDDERYNLKQTEDKYKNIKKIVLGIVISLPILVIIILLLSSADMIFAKGMEEITNVAGKIFAELTIKEMIFRIVLIAIMTVYTIAFIYYLINSKRELPEEITCKKEMTFDNVIANTILTILNIIYCVFCYIQIVNLFMGYNNLSKNEYCEYARQGFFQLMAVSIINLAIILMTTHNKAEGSQTQQLYTKMMNLLLAIFTMIILVSSFMRMYLYEQAFGYTFLRLMVYITLITEAILMIPTVMHIFNKEIDLIKPYFIIILTMYVLVNYINIDGMIARKNIDRYFNAKEAERQIDFEYLTTTGIDGVTEIKRLLRSNDIVLKEKVISYLQIRKDEVSNMNLQELNLNRYRVQSELNVIK